ncbi:MAG: flagellar motor switch protein FliN [Myxococcota bacterium]|jgi:flagellar motor switch protein FliN/FliY|nr:flagellar motor switch protein FliN [Myxococcota bacterium]
MNQIHNNPASSPANPPAGAAPPQASAPVRHIGFLLDIPLELTVEIGRRTMTMGELLDLSPGTVLELDRPAGDHLDILANGKLVARGEAVVIGDRYGIRILEVVGENPFEQAEEGGAP